MQRCWFFHLAVIIAAVPVAAQVQPANPDPEAAFPLDAYGNAQSVDTQWRSVNVFENPVQQQALEGYQTSGRRYGQRSGAERFALPGDVWSVSELSALGTARVPGVRSGLTPAKRSAFRRYGGFAAREKSEEDETDTDMLTRRAGLIAATGLNAPVYRAMARGERLVDLRTSITRTPFLESELPEDPTIDALTLDQRLDRTDAGEHQRLRAEAWALFREGQYRQAIRAFQAAITLQPSDFETRIGEIIAYLSVGGVRTAAALVGELARRDENPFQHDLRLPERFASTMEVGALQLRARQVTENAEQTVSTVAAYVLAMWHLGEREEALRAAESIARREPTQLFALWPDKMRAIRAAAPSPDQGP